MNIYIIGAPTSGKSTLARILKQKMPQLNVISFEAVRNGFIKTQPELDMGNRESAARKEILPQHIVEFAEWNEKMTGDPTLVVGSFASAMQVSELARAEDIIVCLGYGGMALEEIAKRAIKHASQDSYLFGKTEDEFIQHFYDLTDNDRADQKFCMENNVPYFVTAEHRAEKLQEAAAFCYR